MKCRKTPYILQYYVPNKETKPEEYVFQPFRSTYASKLSEPGVIVLPKSKLFSG